MQSDMPGRKLPSRGAVRSKAHFPKLILVNAGEFLMGTSDEQIEELEYAEDWASEWTEKGLFRIEQPMHWVNLPAYEIAQFPVTNGEYYSFIYATGYRTPKTWGGFRYPAELMDHPVAGVSKVDAEAYCKWVNRELRTNFRLPTEAEWEKAARGLDGRIFPWGDTFDPWRCNTLESGKRLTTPVNTYIPGGDSPFGVSDMMGNVSEWTSSPLRPYPFEDVTDETDPRTKIVVRGGAWYYSYKLARCAAREGVVATYVSNTLGFRLARDYVEPSRQSEI